jgi:hypothetical protein
VTKKKSHPSGAKVEDTSLPPRSKPHVPQATVEGKSRRSANKVAKSQPKTNVKKVVPKKTAKRPSRWLPRLLWSFLWLTVAAMVGSMGVASVLWLAKLPPLPNCDRLSSVASDRERLDCVQAAAKSGKLEHLEMAIGLIKTWPDNHPLYGEGQQLMREWSRTLLEMANQKVDEGNVKVAVEIASKIPLASPLYPDAQSQIADWQQDWLRGERIIKKFHQALKVQNWQQASAQLQALPLLNANYWRQEQLDELRRRMQLEKQTWNKLKNIRQLVEGAESQNAPTPEQLAKAIAQAAQINSKTYVRDLAQADQNRWSRMLLQIASDRLLKKDFTGAEAIALKIPVSSPIYQEGQDWILLVRAQAAAKTNALPALLDGLTIARRVKPDSPIYEQAQIMAAGWQSQVQDWWQWELASTIAKIDQPWALEMAINQAEQIAANRPQRDLADNAIANWQLTKQQVENRLILAQAQKLAATGKITNLKAALFQVSQILPDQSLGGESQKAIAQWSRQIQILEDQPTLDLARTFAQKNNLSSAIQTAQQIRPGRVLRREAEEAMITWTLQLQIAEDKPLLEAANALATQGRFSLAIQTVGQIKPNRPLYDEAKEAIARWTAQSGVKSQTP